MKNLNEYNQVILCMRVYVSLVKAFVIWSINENEIVSTEAVWYFYNRHHLHHWIHHTISYIHMYACMDVSYGRQLLLFY